MDLLSTYKIQYGDTMIDTKTFAKFVSNNVHKYKNPDKLLSEYRKVGYKLYRDIQEHILFSELITLRNQNIQNIDDILWCRKIYTKIQCYLQTNKVIGGKMYEHYICNILDMNNIRYVTGKCGHINGDIIIPVKNSFILLSCKTTSKERWKQLVEETNQNNISKVYYMIDEECKPILKAKLNKYNIDVISSIGNSDIKFSEFIQIIKEQQMYLLYDLFCGAGGLSIGFEQAGFQTILAIDNDKTCIDTFNNNRQEKVGHCIDMTKLTPNMIKKWTPISPHIIIGGPPCQSFSMAGKRQQNDPRNSLFKEFLRIVEVFRPLVVVMENVVGILSAKTTDGKAIDLIVQEFNNKGYRVKYKTLNSADYGVPQKRRRVIFLGVRNDIESEIEFPKPTHDVDTWIPVKTVLENNVDIKYYHSQKMIDGFKRRREKNRENGKGFGAQYLDLEKPSYTISARYYKDGSEALVKESETNIRKLTEKEVAQIQTFPNDYKFEGSSSNIYKQIGNAVPCLLARHIAKSVATFLQSLTYDQSDNDNNDNNDNKNDEQNEITEDYLLQLNKTQLINICKTYNIIGYSKLKKLELIDHILKNI